MNYEQVVFIGDEQHRYEKPDLPTRPVEFVGATGTLHTIPLAELILNGDEHYEDAFWKREELPKYFTHYIPDVTELWAAETVWEGSYLVSLNEEDSDRLVYLFDREMYRRENGIHFKNEHTIEYLTGHHYSFLQWIKPYGLNAKLVPKWRQKGYEYAEYREFQRDVFYLIDKVNMDEDILGLYIAKPKKTGITQVFAAYYLNKATTTRMAQMGVMSKGGDAATVNMMMVIHGYDNLPPIFQPNLKNRADQAGDLFFGEPALRNVRTKLGKERRQQQLKAKPLNTRVWAAKTKAAGFDSPTMTDDWFDELPKYWSENKQEPQTVFNRNQETVKLQDIFNGRIWITTYPPEVDDKGFLQGRDIYYKSKKSTIKEGTRRTQTGLIVHYISALNSYTSTFDKYGRCNEVDAKRRNQAERNSVRNDKKAYQAKVRQYSETEKECWSFSGAGSVFDAARVGELMTDQEERQRGAGRTYIDGKLVWENALWEAGAKNTRPLKTWGRVRFVPLTEEEILNGDEGRLRIYSMLLPHDRCLCLMRGKDSMGNLNPMQRIQNVGGTDPTEYAAGSEVIQGSKNANYTMNLPDVRINAALGKVASKIIISEYLYRPDNPQEFYEDLVKEIIFFSKVVIVEANKGWVATKLIQDGLGHYMIVKSKDTGAMCLWTPQMEREKSYSLIRTGADELETIVSTISQYIVKPEAGDEVSKDYGATIESERLLDQISKFTKENHNLHDLVMAWGWCLIAIDVLMTIPWAPPEDPLYSASVIQMVYQGLQN